MTPGQKLKRARHNLPGDPTQFEIDEALGFTRGRTQSYERGSAKPSMEYLRALERVFGVPPDYILDPSDDYGLPITSRNRTTAGSETTLHKLPENAAERFPVPGASPYLVPLYGEIPAGEWAESDADPDWIEVESDLYDSQMFARRVSGNSMDPALRSGDVAFFIPTSTPRDNVIVLASNRDSKKTVKVCRYKEGKWVLEALNPETPPMELEGWILLAKLVAVRRTGAKGFRARYDCDVGLQPDMLPVD